MKIAVFGGSFDPMHIGHLAILEYLQSCPEYDKVYLLVSPQNPLKDGSKARNAQVRLQAAIDAVHRHNLSKVRVEDIEFSMSAPHYSARTLDALQQREQQNHFEFIIGGDNLACLRKWRDYDHILREYGVAVYPREGFDAPALMQDLLADDAAFRIKLLDCPEVTVSSTQIRDAISRGEDISSLLM